MRNTQARDGARSIGAQREIRNGAVRSVGRVGTGRRIIKRRGETKAPANPRAPWRSTCGEVGSGRYWHPQATTAVRAHAPVRHTPRIKPNANHIARIG